jgi:predicted dehydrogenase
MSQPVRIGILSFAHLHAEGYIGALRALPGVEFVGFADDDAERGLHFARVFNAHLYPSYEALLADGVDGVVICTENARHLPLIELAAAAGVGILCEKPLTTSVEDARRATAVCAQAGVVLRTAFPMRFSAPAIEVERLIARGGLGTVYAINSTNQGECPHYHRAWFVDPVLAGGGALSDHIVHVADMLRWMLRAEPVEVYAETNHILDRHEAPLVETGGLVSLRYSDETIVTIDCSWSKPPYYPTWGGLAMDVIGSGGLATMNAFGQNLTVYTHPNRRPHYAFWGSDANGAMLSDFAAALRGQASRGATGEDGARAVLVVAAAYESVRTGQPVAVPAGV